MDFHLTAEQQRLQHKCRELAADFASRSAAHDRDASHPIENYERLREEGFLALSVGKEWGGAGASFLDHTIAYEVLGQGCPSTALAFNMHASVVMPLLQSAEVSVLSLAQSRSMRAAITAWTVAGTWMAEGSSLPSRSAFARTTSTAAAPVDRRGPLLFGSPPSRDLPHRSRRPRRRGRCGRAIPARRASAPSALSAA